MKQKLNLGVIAMVLGLLTAMAGTSNAQTAAGTPSLSIGGIEQAGGTIKGMVKFEGKQHPQKVIRMKTDKTCSKHNKQNPPRSERWVFGDNNTLQNAFVWVSKGLEGMDFPVPTQPAVLDQRGCMYIPHVLGVSVGQKLEIRNSDNTLHNVNCSAQYNDSFNEGMGAKSLPLIKQFSDPELAIPMQCNVHPWMTAYVHVVEHPFYAVTQQDGSFVIRGLPPGEYTLSVWHEFRAFVPDKSSITVTVQEGNTQEVTFTYAPKKKTRTAAAR